jgi:hypothetical protein
MTTAIEGGKLWEEHKNIGDNPRAINFGDGPPLQLMVSR